MGRLEQIQDFEATKFKEEQEKWRRDIIKERDSLKNELYKIRKNSKALDKFIKKGSYE